MKKSYRLRNLDCPSCASELEILIKKVKGVNNAQIDFMTLKLNLDFSGDEKEIIEEIKKVVYDYEEVQVINEKVEEQKENHLFTIISIAFAAVILVCMRIFTINSTIKTIIYLFAYVIVGYEVLIKSIKNIVRGNIFDENFLMTVASIGAICIGMNEEAVAVMLFYSIGELFQDMAVNKSRNMISSLMQLKPEFARIITNGEEKKVNPEEVEVGSLIKVIAGEKIPLDGKIVEGNASVDYKSLTGESAPIEVSAGSEALSGGVNINGVLTIKTEKLFKDGSVAKILDLVENSQSRKSKEEYVITKFAKVYTPCVCGLALILALIPPLFDAFNFSKWIYRALIFLVVSCPCALVISVPLSFFSGIGVSAKNGILIKGSNYFDSLAKSNIAFFDKTGTITDGAFALNATIIEKGFEKVFENYLVSIENCSNHPLAKAVTLNKTSTLKVNNSEELSGLGISGEIEGKKVLCGNERLLKENNIEVKIPEISGAKLYLAIDGKYAGCAVVGDRVKVEAKETIDELKKLGFKKLIMLSGDNNESVERAAKQASFDEWYGKLMPSDKADKVSKLLSNEDKVIFVGDGINDAPVLRLADVGVSMGGVGSDLAIESSDVVVMNDDLRKIPLAVKYARRTLKIVKENMIIALAAKIIVLGLSAFGLTTMWAAVVADVGVMVVAVFNSLRNHKQIR